MAKAALQAIEQHSEVTAFEQWLAIGRNLVDQRRNVDWLLGDWLAEGKERYPEQVGFDFLADALGIAPRRLKDIDQAVRAFPAHMRDTTLTIEHHAGVASLPVQEALPLLKQAKEQHWTPEQTRVEASRLRMSDRTHERAAPDADSALASFIHHWNRLPRQVRLEAAELIADAEGGEIEP